MLKKVKKKKIKRLVFQCKKVFEKSGFLYRSIWCCLRCCQLVVVLCNPSGVNNLKNIVQKIFKNENFT